MDYIVSELLFTDVKETEMQQKNGFVGKYPAWLIIIGVLTFALSGCVSSKEGVRDDGGDHSNNDAGQDVDLGGDDIGVVDSSNDGGKDTDEGEDVGEDVGETPSEVEREVFGTISEDETWEGTITVSGKLEIDAVVTVKPCTTILVAAEKRITVSASGAIQSIGTENCKVTIKSAEETPASGDWDSIHIARDAIKESVFEHTNFLHAGSYGAYGALYVNPGAKVSLKNVRIESMASVGLTLAKGAKLGAFSDIHFSDIGGEPLQIDIELAGKLDATITGEEIGRPWISLINTALNKDQTLEKLAFPYYISKSVNINASLEVAAGTTILMGPGTGITVTDTGSLAMLGEAGSRIIIESSEKVKAAGDWDTISIWKHERSINSVFNYTTIRHGGGGNYDGAINVSNGATVEFHHVVFEGNKGCDVNAKGTVDADAASSYRKCS